MILARLLLASFLLSPAAAMSTASSSSRASSSTSSSSASTMLSLGPAALRSLVRRAAAEELMAESGRGGLDLGGLHWLEHVNLVVGDAGLARAFYVDALGLTPDASRSFHVNLGQQQFHLAENGEPAQRVAGSIGLAVPSLPALRDRLAAASGAFRGTQFAVVDDPEDASVLTVVCPWGNRFHVYDVAGDADYRDAATAESTAATGPSSDSEQKMVRLHSLGGDYGPHRMAVRGQPGIRYVELACPASTAPAIADFYRRVLGCAVAAPSADRAVVSAGPGVHLVFVEQKGLSEADLAAMRGVHLCVYSNDFAGLYRRLSDLGLVWTNPRFTHLDRCDTWEEAAASRTLRFRSILDLQTGQPVLELEHETRSLRHGQYLKVPAYEPK